MPLRRRGERDHDSGGRCGLAGTSGTKRGRHRRQDHVSPWRDADAAQAHAKPCDATEMSMKRASGYRLLSLLPLALTAALLLAAAPRAFAHDEAISSSEVVVSDHDVVWKVDVGTAGLAKALNWPGTGSDLNEAALEAARPEIARYLAGSLEIRSQGVLLPPQPGVLEPRYETLPETGKPGIARVVLALHHASDRVIDELDVRVQFFADLTAQHRALIKVTWGSDQRQYTRLGRAQLHLVRGQLFPSSWNTTREFLLWGCQHIFLGYDHIAFLLALLLAITRLDQLVKIVTSFTVAHSATLLLSALQIVAVPARLTEVLIAASIIYIAAENLLWAERSARHRWLITFGFGLVHGLGFATELRARLAEGGGGVVVPVLTFNLGVEIGQLAIVAVVFPLLTLLRRDPSPTRRDRRQRTLLVAGSLPILALGLAWFVARLAA
jgi:hydrogenase/urease accessory protein HupE